MTLEEALAEYRRTGLVDGDTPEDLGLMTPEQVEAFICKRNAAPREMTPSEWLGLP